jgi:anti-sigma factor RsiW
LSQAPFDDATLMAYADGELDPVTRREVELHCSRDPDARAKVEMYRRSAQMLRDALAAQGAGGVPADLRAEVERLLSRERRRRRWLVPLAAAIVLAMLADLAWHLWPSRHANDPVAHLMLEAADHHAIFAAEPVHFVEVPPDDVAHIESWLGKRVNLSFRVPDLSSRSFEFKGARMMVVEGRPVAQLLYARPGGARIALNIAQGGGARTESLPPIQRHGISVRGRTADGHVFLVAGPAGDSALERDLEAIAADLPSLLQAS